MSFNYISDDVVLCCFLSYLDYKTIYNLSLTNKYFTYIIKIYKKFKKQKNIEIYFYIISEVKNNIINNLQRFLDLLFDTSISLDNRIYKYNKDISDGIYYYSKTFFYKENSQYPFYFYPILSFRSHNMYIIIYVKNKEHKSRIFKYYYYNHLEEEEINYVNLKDDEKVIKLL